ncbi:MAG TPA: type I polyketide synthase, partial [Solirubrobacterales bacterium]
PLELEFVYDRLAEHGLNYGPAFQGLSAAWRDGTEVYAEVSLADEQVQEAARFAIHPALLDSAFHAGLGLALDADESIEARAGRPALPFIWSGVSVALSGASSLRVRVGFDGDRFDLTALDESNAPLAVVDSVMTRPVEQNQLETARHRKSLYRVEWTEVEARHSANGSQPPRPLVLGEEEIPGIEAERYPDLPALLEAIGEGEGPVVAIADARSADPRVGSPVETAHSTTRSVLELLQAWVGEESLEDVRLVLLTKEAIAAGECKDPDLVTAPLWGLLRSAHSEYPGRFAILDTDDSEASRRALGAAFEEGVDEPQLALREGQMLAPRLARVEEAETDLDAAPIAADSTVLITGGTGGLGGVVARHLAAEHGVRHLLLINRGGEESKGAKELKATLEELGAEVTIAACDVTEREQLRELIDSLPAERPLGAVIHAAGILDDALLASMDRERLQRVMVPKVDAAWHLHELTKELGLSRFVMFSSSAGLLGGAGQTNYAAANAFLDALAAHRHAQGLPATALAWGKWDQESGTAAGLSDAELMHILRQIRERLGFVPMSPQQGVALLDVALGLDDPLLAPVELDPRVLRDQAQAGNLPAILRGLVRASARRTPAGETLASRIARLGEHEREPFALDFVRTQVAAVLGHGSARSIDVERAFKDLGFDSLAAVELRNRLGAASGMHLPATLVFDYPSSVAIAGYLLAAALPVEGERGEPTEELDESTEAGFREALARVSLARLREAGLMAPLLELVDLDGDSLESADDDPIERIQAMNIDDLVERTLERQGAEVVFGDDE